MNKKPRTPARSANPGADIRSAALQHGHRKAASLARAQALSDFDAEAWIALLAEQRMRIAMAAGVDPSKVKIHLGH